MVAIWTPGRYPIQEVVSNSKEGYTIAKVNGVFFCSCYAPPRWPLDHFSQVVHNIVVELADRRPVVIAGDFNAWAVEWGSSRTNPRGQILLEALASLNVEVANVGTKPTYGRNGSFSIIDVTFGSPGLISHWKVNDGYTNSDHQAVSFKVGQRARRTTEGGEGNQTTRRWKTQHFDVEVFSEAIRWEYERRAPVVSEDRLVEVLSHACDATMPRRSRPRHQRPPVYWWTAEIANLRSACHRARRMLHRARSEEDKATSIEIFRVARSTLKQAIRSSKRACFDGLCREANSNPWGDAYRIVMSKTKAGAPSEKSPEMLERIIGHLFPRHEIRPWPSVDESVRAAAGDAAIVTNDELVEIAGSLRVNKAPGPDGILNVAIKAAINAVPDLLRSVMQWCLDEGVFPDRWKRQSLVLLPKTGKPPGDPSAYRPICLLDTAGKVLERVILNRLTSYSEDGLSDSQFGFRKGRSTVDAIRSVTTTAEVALERKRRGIRYCAVVTLDVRNAFNCASWEAIANALQSIGVPGYLYKILGSYFQNRVLLYDTEDGQRSSQVTAGVPQGSILGPVLWNIMYDGVLRLRFPRGVKLVGFADDITLEVYGESIVEVEQTAAQSIRHVEEWMQSRKLELAHHKTEVIVVNNRKSEQQATVIAGECTITSQRSLKHLGVMIDDKLSFGSHVEYACKRASTAISALSRMMSNSSAVYGSKRKLLAGVATSILRYGGPVWASALRKNCYKEKLESKHRLMCLRVASAYRTVSYDAVCVIAGMMPIGFLIQEDVECHEGRDTRGVRKTARTVSLAHWQREWASSTKGRWTHRLIPEVAAWINRRHGEVEFHLTQILSGHGCFRQYLHRFRHAATPACPVCVDVEETAEHVLFECPRFEEVRSDMLAVIGQDTAPVNLVQRMCQNVAYWNAVSGATRRIMTELQRTWRAAQREYANRQ